MSNELWETVDWGDDEVVDTPSEHLAMSPSIFDRKETAGTVRLSGSSAGSEHEHPLDHSVNLPSKMVASPEMKQYVRNKRGSWFDFEVNVTKLVPLEDEQGGCGRSRRNDSPREHEAKRRLRRRQSDFAVQKQRVLEKQALEDTRPIDRSLTKRFLSSVGLGKNTEATAVSDDEKLDVPFPTSRTRRRSCY